MVAFQVINEFSAPKGNAPRGGDVPYRLFKAGERVTGYEHPDYGGIAVLENEWVMPIENLTSLGEASASRNDDEPVMELPKEFQAELDRIKKTDFVKDVMNKSQASMQWMFAGGLIGFLFALITKKNIFFSTIISGVGFGLIGYNLKMPAMDTNMVLAANKPKG